MKNFAKAILDLAHDLFNMYIHTVSNVPDARGMEDWCVVEKDGKTYEVHMKIWWDEI